ncbi:ABC transporter permease [Neolewinella lacunae]|uniref:ABC transporter permease n=1 Tax=Neolewinella lacunae TaxID=1517758 RepID=A0A923T914_9BACT|nr:ABC transporter permease [Neolewinella lacunae]MBC6995096.1 ABC transporter permease [Neolewinella lacunae]MDN3634046.1 ABC transporter permease [Neolewinella lacunae]
MQSYLAFVRKEFYHILRDTRTLVILFGMPIAQVLIFGYAVTNEFRDAPVAVIDNARDELSRELVHELVSSGYFKLVDQPATADELDALFRAGEVKLGVFIPPDFESDFFRRKQTTLQFLADGSDPNYATTLLNYGSQIVGNFQQRHAGGPENYQVGVEMQLMYNPELISAYNFIPGVVAIILLLISAMMTSLTIAKEKEMGTMDLLLVSPLSPLTIILGKVTPYVLLSMSNALLILLLGYFVFDVPVLGSFWLLTGFCLLYVLTALSLGILISTKASSQQAAMMGSLFSLLMPSMLLSGFIFPITSMPWMLQKVSGVIPATYFIELLKGVMLKGLGMQYLWFPTLVLATMTVVLLSLSWFNFKIRTK